MPYPCPTCGGPAGRHRTYCSRRPVGGRTATVDGVPYVFEATAELPTSIDPDPQPYANGGVTGGWISGSCSDTGSSSTSSFSDSSGSGSVSSSGEGE